MDLSPDFPNAQIFEAQAIIQKFNKMIEEINLKKDTIRKMHDTLDSETQKMDVMAKDVRNIRVQLKRMDLQSKNSLQSLEKSINESHKNLMANMETKINSIDVPETNIGAVILVSSIVSLSLGVALGLFFSGKVRF